MSLGRAAPLALALALLACAAAHAAANDPNDPRVKTTAAGQAAAEAAVLRSSDLGGAWAQVVVATPYTIKVPVCATHETNYSALTLSGHAETEFSLSSEITVDADVEVYASSGQVDTLFHKMLQPNLDGCLRYDLFKSVGREGTIGAVARLPLLRAGSHTAAYRITVLYPVKGKTVPVDSDYLFVANHATAFFVSVIAPGDDQSELAPLEQRIADVLAVRARA
jgi:hypothetical protein